jgi:hypothetical protein
VCLRCYANGVNNEYTQYSDVPVLSKNALETLPAIKMLSEWEHVTFCLASLSHEIPTGIEKEIGSSEGKALEKVALSCHINY